jgi:hypothetical protein
MAILKHLNIPLEHLTFQRKSQMYTPLSDEPTETFLVTIQKQRKAYIEQPAG